MITIFLLFLFFLIAGWIEWRFSDLVWKDSNISDTRPHKPVKPARRGKKHQSASRIVSTLGPGSVRISRPPGFNRS
jgi:hypothetical protein